MSYRCAACTHHTPGTVVCLSLSHCPDLAVLLQHLEPGTLPSHTSHREAGMLQLRCSSSRQDKILIRQMGLQQLPLPTVVSSTITRANLTLNCNRYDPSLPSSCFCCLACRCAQPLLCYFGVPRLDNCLSQFTLSLMVFYKGEYERNLVSQAPASGAIKLCRRCNQHKPLTEFYRSKANADGYDGRCKACDAIQCAERRRKKPRVEVRIPLNTAPLTPPTELQDDIKSASTV